MTDLKYGDMICYKLVDPLVRHDAPIMFISECRHTLYGRGYGDGLIDILSIPEGVIDHKAGETWERCEHRV